MAHSTTNHALYTIDNLQIPSSQVVLVYTEWNSAIVDALREGAKEILAQFPQVTLHEYCVPGAVEIPHAIATYQALRGADAYITLGCVIKGETPHFDFVCRSVTDGITSLNLSIDRPVIFGVLTVLNEEQAHDRLGGKHGHKGKEAAMAALKMISFRNSLILKS